MTATLRPALKPSARAVLRELELAGASGLTPLQALRDLGVYRLSGRIHELRRAGHVIRCEHVRDSVYRYVLEGGL